MERILALLGWLLQWIPWLPKPRFQTRYAERYPNTKELTECDLVVVRSGEHLKWACFLCPCGCGQKISLSLVREQRPLWTVRSDWRGRPTVSPSVGQTAGCYSHFWIRDGRVDWCPGTGRPYHGTGLVR